MIAFSRNNILLLLLISSQLLIKSTNGKKTNTCNDGCLVKTYKLAKDGSFTCSGDNCAMEASFRADIIHGQVVLSINLSGDILDSVDSHGVILTHSNDVTKYDCTHAITFGTSAEVVVNGRSIKKGSSLIRNRKIYCSWSMTRSDDIWPVYSRGVSFPMINQTDLNIQLEVSGTKYLVASDISELPIYRMQYLKCCNKVHGNDDYQFVVKRTENAYEFVMLTTHFSSTSYYALLTDSKGIKLEFGCYLGSQTVTGYLRMSEDNPYNIPDFDIHVEPGYCSWKMPLIINIPSISYDPSNAVYDLELVSEGKTVYTESGVHLKSFSSRLVPTMFLMITIFIHFLL